MIAVMPFFKGMAGTGKSTIIGIVEKMFDKVDVGTMSNNAEKTFGLSSLADKFVFVAPDVKSDLVLDQAEVCDAVFPTYQCHDNELNVCNVCSCNR